MSSRQDFHHRHTPPVLAIAVALCVASVAWAALNSLFTFPYADDFCYGARASRLGALASVADEYLHWGGRYTATFLLSLFSENRRVLLDAYWLIPIAVIVSTALATLRLMRTLGLRDPVTAALATATLVSACSWSESVYWLAGGFTYGLACALLLALLALELELLWNGLRPSGTTIGTAMLGAFLLSGFNETVMLVHLALLALMILRAARQGAGRATLVPLALWLLAALVGALVVLLAPGNSVRSAEFPARDLAMAMFHTSEWLLERYALPLLGTVLMFRLLLGVRPRDWATRWPAAQLAEGAVLMLAGTWVSIFTRAYAISDFGPYRARTVDFMLLTVAGLLLAMLWVRPRTQAAALSMTGRDSTLKRGWVAALIVLLFALHPGPDGSWAMVAARMVPMRSYAQYMTQRLTTAEAGRDSSVGVPSYRLPAGARHGLAVPVTLRADISADPQAWQNLCVSRYFGLRAIHLEPEPFAPTADSQTGGRPQAGELPRADR